MHIPPPGMEMVQLAKKLGWREKWMDSRSLARLVNYPQIGKKSRYDLNMEGLKLTDKVFKNSSERHLPFASWNRVNGDSLELAFPVTFSFL
jgi:hypothetical protein